MPYAYSILHTEYIHIRSERLVYTKGAARSIVYDPFYINKPNLLAEVQRGMKKAFSPGMAIWFANECREVSNIDKWTVLRFQFSPWDTMHYPESL